LPDVRMGEPGLERERTCRVAAKSAPRSLGVWL
jgi:hypothetical protein